MPPMATACPACAAKNQKAVEDIFGPAQTTAQTQKRDELRRLGLLRKDLLALPENAALRQRNSEASLIEAHLRALTLTIFKTGRT